MDSPMDIDSSDMSVDEIDIDVPTTKAVFVYLKNPAFGYSRNLYEIFNPKYYPGSIGTLFNQLYQQTVDLDKNYPLPVPMGTIVQAIHLLRRMNSFMVKGTILSKPDKLRLVWPISQDLIDVFGPVAPGNFLDPTPTPHATVSIFIPAPEEKAILKDRGFRPFKVEDGVEYYYGTTIGDPLRIAARMRHCVAKFGKPVPACPLPEHAKEFLERLKREDPNFLNTRAKITQQMRELTRGR